MFTATMVICALVLLICIIVIINKSNSDGTNTTNQIEQKVAHNLAVAEQKMGSYTAKVRSGLVYILYDEPTHRILLNREIIDSTRVKFYRTTENDARHYYLLEIFDEDGIGIFKQGLYDLDMYSQVKEFFLNNLNLSPIIAPQEIYVNKMKDLISELGEPTKLIPIEPDNFTKQIIVFEDKKILHILGKEYKMSDILGCSYNDSAYVKKGDIISTSTTKTDTGNMVGRAVIGGALLGTTGAVIGGSTANKNTTTVSKQESDRLIHNYTITINVDSLTSPVITIECGNRIDLVNEIIGLMNVIIKRNQN